MSDNAPRGGSSSAPEDFRDRFERQLVNAIKENHMTTETLDTPKFNASITGLGVDDGQQFMVRYRDGSDSGLADVFFTNEDAARAWADDLEANPPKGNHFHPAPSYLDIRVFAVERLR